jgi:putative membrane protein
MGWHDMNGTDWIWATTMMVLFWGAIAAVVITLLRRATTGSTPRDTPEETLQQRLARGEIDIDEYHQRLEALHSPIKR